MDKDYEISSCKNKNEKEISSLVEISTPNSLNLISPVFFWYK